MEQAPVRKDEARRLAALRQYGLLDTLAEPEFDDFTQLAAYICGTPIALISLVDSSRQWFKSRFGLAATETPRDISFCGHAIHGNQVFEVPDTLLDPRFADNPLVTGAPDIRFYAGMPLITPDGYGIGTLCVIDQVAHKLTPEQSASLAALGRQVVRQFELRMSVARLEEGKRTGNLLANLLHATTDLSMIATDPNGLISLFNRGAEQLLGYFANEVVGSQALLDFYLPSEVDVREMLLSQQLGRPVRGFEVFTAIAQQQGSERQKWRMIHRDGHLVPVMLSVTTMRDDMGNILGYLSLALDISRESLASEVIRAAEVGIWDFDVPKNLLAWDDVMYRLYGTKSEDFLGCFEAWEAGVHPDDKERSQSEIALALSGEKPFNTEFRVIWPDGSVHWIRARAMVQRDIQGRVLRMMGANWDITQIKHAEQAKSDFVATVSHELRTPLTSIKGALGLINGGVMGEVPAKLKPMLDIVTKNTLRLGLLINDLLDMEKMLAGGVNFEFKGQTLLPLLSMSIDAIRPYGEPLQVGFALVQPDPELKVLVDGQRLQQVLANLMSNAAKFSPPGSQVELKMYRQAQWARVEVQDYGPGIPFEFRGRIFQKFSQAEAADARQKGGTGLGLAISKEIVERMHGRIGFDSEIGRGTCFYFELPLWHGTSE